MLSCRRQEEEDDDLGDLVQVPVKLTGGWCCLPCVLACRQQEEEEEDDLGDLLLAGEDEPEVEMQKLDVVSPMRGKSLGWG